MLCYNILQSHITVLSGSASNSLWYL